MVDEHTDHTAEESEQLVVFQLSDELFGVNIAMVNTILRKQEITAIPQTPDFVEGVTNLRGTIIPVINLGKRFGFLDREATRSSRIIVVETLGNMVGLMVDAVVETLKLRNDCIEPPPSVVRCVEAEYLRGVGKTDNGLVILLDLEKVLTGDESGQLDTFQKHAQRTAA
ncbi:MAG: chemotaxis protein CheW [Armatimonadota bacterium]